MYLPNEINRAHVLITVKTYPNPSDKYDELVCNAGFLKETGQWIRIYPIRFRALPYDQQYKKYDWIELDLVRNTSDFRRESYKPRQGIDEKIQMLNRIDTGKNRDWNARKQFALREVFTSMNDLIGQAKKPIYKSLATVKPKEFVKFEIVEVEDREWPQKIRDELKQMSLLASRNNTSGRELDIVRKLPYSYYYHFRTDDNEKKPRRLMIQDWEIGALYWNCLTKTDGDEQAANELVRQKYETDFFEKDTHLFVGTVKRNHNVAPNPFVIIGVFPPPHTSQPTFNF